MKYIIEFQKLQPGDIALITWDDRKSGVIRKLSNSDYSHAMIYVDGHSFIHSSLEGVEASNPQRFILDSPGQAAFFRCPTATPAQVEEIIHFARSKVGTAYSLDEAKLSIRGHSDEAKEENRQFCTRFAAQAYEAADIKLTESPAYCTPKDLEESPLLIRLEGCIREATTAEIEFGEQSSPILERQKEIINSIMSKAREVSGQDIQTFEQLETCLLENSQHDEAFDTILRESGWLDMWRYDYEKNPWYYSIKAFEENVPAHQRKSAAKFQLDLAKRIDKRFSTEYILQRLQLSKIGSKYFRTTYELDKKLLELSRRRIQTAEEALERYAR